MSKINNKYFSYALNENEELINAENAVKGQQYFCPFCKATMIARQGNIRKWHFAHKNSTHECSFESYLHKLGKIRIKEAFLKSQEFNITYNVPTHCNNEDCKFKKKEDRCQTESQATFNLKQYYDSCEVEKQYKNFVADLLISSSKAPERAPILIEIYVNHKCTNEKISDGVRIIEISIGSEEDIDNIISASAINGIRHTGKKTYWDKPKNIFYNFDGSKKKQPDFFDEFYIADRIYYYCYILDTGYFKFGKCKCYENPMDCIPPNAHYIISTSDFNWDWAILKFWELGLKIGNCEICKYSSYDDWGLGLKCHLYRRFNTPKFPKRTEGKTCQYFRRKDSAHQRRFVDLNAQTNNHEFDENYYIGINKQS